MSSLDDQIRQAQENQGEANFLNEEETDELSLYEKVLLEAGDDYERGLAVVSGLLDVDRDTYMQTEGRRFLLENAIDRRIDISSAIDILEYERASDGSFDEDYMRYLIEANEQFKIRMAVRSEDPGEVFITEYAAYLEHRGMFTERTEFLKQHGRYNPLNEG